MCGIHVIIDKSGKANDDHLKKMTEEARHRGPDHTGLYTTDWGKSKIWIGVNHLMISDNTPNSTQPFHTDEGHYSLAYNGEIYNHYELKNELLQDGVIFSTRSDTEVLANYLAKHGKGSLKDLNGMFGLVFFDHRNKSIIVARDRQGIKPLYYYSTDELLIISSSIKAIANCNLVDTRVDQTQIDYYLQYGYMDAPATFFKNISEVSPGSVLEVDQNSGIKYHTIPSNSIINNVTAEPGKVRELLTDALLRQIDTPKPVGLMLSGGVDSTLLMAIAYREGITLPTYSLVSKPGEKVGATADNKFALKAANIYLSPNHHQIYYSDDDLEDFNTFADALEQPNADPGAFSNYLLAREACKEVKVLMNGAGADEYFTGYNRHAAFLYYMNHRKSLLAMKPYAQPLLRSLSLLGMAGSQKLAHLHKFFNDVSFNPSSTFNNFISDEYFFSKEQKRGFDEQDPLTYILRHDQKNYLIKNVLAISDQMTMAHSIEMRVPYLDNELIDYAASLPGRELIRNGKKWLLKELLVEEGGMAFTKRKKEGFGPPIGAWLRKKKNGQYIDDIVGSKVLFDYVDKALVMKLLKIHATGRQDHGRRIWKLMVLNHWLQKYSR